MQMIKLVTENLYILKEYAYVFVQKIGIFCNFLIYFDFFLQNELHGARSLQRHTRVG